MPGGVQHHVLELAEALRLLGQDVSVLAPGEESATLPAYVVPAGRAVPVRYNGSVARLSFGPGAFARVRRWLAAAAPDVLHVHEPTAPSLSLLALWAAEVPTVATFHTAMPARSRAMAVVRPVLRPALERIDARIAVSALALHTMRRHVGGDGVVLPNGVWVQPFADARAQAEVAGGADCAPTVAFLGRTEEPRKGLEVLLRAWPAVARRHRGARLVVAGHGDVERVRARAAALLPADLSGAVEVVGPVGGRSRTRVLGRTDVFVAPQTGGESFGVVLLEAMAAGAAVLASDLPAFAAVLDGGRLGSLFRAGDPTALAAGLDALLGDTARRAQMVARARDAVRAYDWSIVARRVLRVHGAVISAGVPAQPRRDRDAAAARLGWDRYRSAPTDARILP